jgi:beta-galactosidase
MPEKFSRRGFLNTAAQAGIVSQLKLDAASAAAAPDEVATERRKTFDDGWRFSRGDIAGAHLPDFQDAAWNAVDLPHDWSIAGPFDEDDPSGGQGGYLPTGIGWYRKPFVLPAAMAGKRVQIQFDGVYQCSGVWINGQHLGMRPYGFITFAYDLTPHLHFGGEPNIVAVRVDNSLQPNARWYTGSGIYRHTWLITTTPVHIATWGHVRKNVRGLLRERDRGNLDAHRERIGTRRVLRAGDSHPGTQPQFYDDSGRVRENSARR